MGRGQRKPIRMRDVAKPTERQFNEEFIRAVRHVVEQIRQEQQRRRRSR